MLHGARDRVQSEAGRLPDLLAALVVVSTDLTRAVDDDLFAPVVADDERRRPVGAVGARRAPDVAPGGGIEHRQDAVALVIEQHDQPALVEDRPHALAELLEHAHLNVEVALPERRAVHVVGEQSARAERRVDPLAVGGRRVRGEAAVGGVITLVRDRGGGRLPPDDLARRAVESQDLEPLLFARACAAVAATSASTTGSARWFRRSDRSAPQS